MHLLKTDLEYGTIVSSGRKSVTLHADTVNFKLRRVVRKPYERIIREGLERDLGIAGYQQLHAAKEIWTDSLAAWPTQFPLAKFSVRRWTDLFWLTAIDERGTDSYLLKTREWGHVEKALASLTSGLVLLPDPLILEVANPLACYAPFTPPSWEHFENVNKKVRSALQEAIEALHTQAPAGYLSPKLAAHYLRLQAEVEALHELPRLAPPSGVHFELPK